MLARLLASEVAPVYMERLSLFARLLEREFGHERFASQSVLERCQQNISLVDGSGLRCGAATAARGDERIAQRTAEGKEETAPTQDTPLTSRFNDRREHACPSCKGCKLWRLT